MIVFVSVNDGILYIFIVIVILFGISVCSCLVWVIEVWVVVVMVNNKVVFIVYFFVIGGSFLFVISLVVKI